MMHDDAPQSDEEVEAGLPDVVMTAVFQSSRLGAAWYDSARGEVRRLHTPRTLAGACEARNWWPPRY